MQQTPHKTTLGTGGGRESNADKDNQLLQCILEMKALNIGERKIAKKLGISYGKVRSLLRFP